MGRAIVKDKRLAPLIRAIDELAVAEAKYMAGEVKYRVYADATDKVIAERDKLGLQSMRITRR